MQQYFSDTTNVTSFSLETRDWFALGNSIVSQQIYEDFEFQLKGLQRVADPPTGQTLMTVTNVPLGVIFQLYYNIRESDSKEVFKSMVNRFTAVLQGMEGTYPAITTFLADYTTQDNLIEAELREFGRRLYRGKLA